MEKKMSYLRLTTGLNDVGTLIPKTENPYNLILDKDKDYYLSLYQYNEEQKKKAEEEIEITTDSGTKYKRNRGVSGINEVATNLLVFDFDSEDDVEIARQDTISLCERLKDNGIDLSKVNISFSGNKGFSVVVSHTEDLSPEQHKKIAVSLAGDLETFDPKVYNASRIFRLDYTKHASTGLYKTPITYSQLKTLNVEKIKKLAQQKRNPQLSKNEITLPETIKNLKKLESKKVEVELKIDSEIDFSQKPTFLSKAKFILHKGHIPKGYGNYGMMILASTYKKAGLDKVDAFNMLLSVNDKRTMIYGEEFRREESDIKTQVIDVVYGPTWNGGTYNEKENELLASINEKYNIAEQNVKKTKKIGDVKERFKKFITNINKNIIKTGIKTFDKNVMLMTGQLVGVLGSPGSGKTSLVTTIIENLSRNGTNVLFESLDMHDNMMMIRMLQKVSGIDMDKKIRKMIKDDPSYDSRYNMFSDFEVQDAFKKMEETYKNVDFCFDRGSSVDIIEQHILETKERVGDNLKLVVVDYLEKVPSEYSDPTASTGLVARKLSDLASKHDVCIMLLLQPQKSAGDASEELLSLRQVKGASVIEQDCRVILSIWRPGFDPEYPEDDNFTSIAVVKNNMGDVCKMDFSWNGLTGKIDELNADQLLELKNLVERRKVEKDEKKEKPF